MAGSCSLEKASYLLILFCLELSLLLEQILLRNHPQSLLLELLLHSVNHCLVLGRGVKEIHRAFSGLGQQWQAVEVAVRVTHHQRNRVFISRPTVVLVKYLVIRRERGKHLKLPIDIRRLLLDQEASSFELCVSRLTHHSVVKHYVAKYLSQIESL